jgi:hypothetical protein
LYLDNGMREDGDKVMEIYQRLITEKETEREQAAPKEK